MNKIEGKANFIDTMVIPTKDIVEEILKHLPTKSLGRLKTVSKPWRFLIESTYFTHKRLTCWGLEIPIVNLLVVHPPSRTLDDPSSKTFLLETVSKDQDNNNNTNNGQICRSSSGSYTFPSPTNESKHGVIKVLGSCDGLVLVSFYEFSYICLINPTTREHRALSPASLHLPGEMTEMLYTMGFGKDIVTGSYKVILMYFVGFKTLKTKVLSLDTGEQRDSGFFPVYNNHLCDKQTSVFASGSLFWLTVPSRLMQRTSCHLRQRPPKLLALDLHTENFRRVSLPSWYTMYSPSMHMWSIKDRLCLSDVLQCPDIDIWSLQQENPNETWEKIFSFDVLNIGQLNADFLMLGLTSAYFRRTRDEDHTREQASNLDQLRVISYLPTLVSPYQGRSF